MINKMTPATLTDQFANDARQVMFYGFAVMIATALVFALLSALTIAKGVMGGDDGINYIVRIPYWCVSVLAVCMVYLKLHTYGRFITHSMTVLDVLIPLAKAFTASALFAVLNYEDARTWQLWPLVFSIFALISHFKIRYYHSKFDETNASQETAELLRMIRENARRSDLPATAIFGVSFGVIWLLLNFFSPLRFMAGWSPNWQALLAIPAAFAMVMAINSDKDIRAKVAALLITQTANPRKA
jgi:hypothetical protein